MIRNSIQVTALLMLIGAILAGLCSQPAGAGSLPHRLDDDGTVPGAPGPNTLWLPIAFKPDDGSSTPASDSWSTAAANPQRTSWVAEAVDPQVAGKFGLEWYRPIEAYIGQNVQLIAARGKIYAATARGLYALTAANGDVAWRFDTELPLGNSPTVAGNVVYVGGLDRRVYALNADTGALIWTFTGSKGGFSTNPLVQGGLVMLGSRDGYFYALDAITGALRWQYPAPEAAPLGPILYSAAYKDGKVFFAANDNHAYALQTANGALVWRSALLPGDGYQGWWPVVYGNYVVYSAAPGYAEGADIGTNSVAAVVSKNDPYYATMHNFQYSTDLIKTLQRDDVFHSGEGNSDALGPVFTTGSASDRTGISWSWGNGRSVVDGAKAAKYLEDDGQALVNRPTNKPWRRSVIVLSSADGSEFTYDSDGNGKPEFAPFLAVGAKSGNRYPPVVIPTRNAGGQMNDVLYAQNLSQNQTGWGIPKTRLMGWQFGTQYLYPVGDEGAIDEPYADSAGGSILYHNLCCDRAGSWYYLTTQKAGGAFWGYADPLESIKLTGSQIPAWQYSVAPGYDEMWWGASMFDNYPRLYGNYGTMNGIYHNHGLQNPLIPYQGRIFAHRSNAIIALGPQPAALPRPNAAETPEQYEQRIKRDFPQVARPLLKIVAPAQAAGPLLSASDVQADLNREIASMLKTGHLRPGYFNSTRGYSEFANYFENPGDTLLTLTAAYPYVAADLQPQLAKYIKQHYQRYFGADMFSRTGYWVSNPTAYDLNNPSGLGQLQPREWMPVPPEVEQAMHSHLADGWPAVGWPWSYPQQNFYAMWLYAQQFYSQDAATLKQIYASARSKLQSTPPDDNTLADKPWVHNAFIAGYTGFLNLQQMAGMAQQDAALRATVQANLNTLLSTRAAKFQKDSPWAAEDLCCSLNVIRRGFNVARNFLYMTPELAAYLRQNAAATVQAAVSEYDAVAPNWMATRYEASFGEFATDSLYTNNSMFMAKAYILREPTSQLLKYLDVPAFKTGDLFYLQNLVAILDSQK